MARRRAVWDGTFRDYVIALRTKTNVSQAALARTLGIGQNTIARWETGTESQRREARGLTRDALTRYARANGFPDPPPRSERHAEPDDSGSGVAEV